MILFLITLILCLRALFLFFWERRATQALSALFFLFCLVLLRKNFTLSEIWPYKMLLLLALLAAAGVSCALRLARGPKHTLLKLGGLTVFIVAVSIQLAIAGFLHITHDESLVKVVIPGVRKDTAHLVQIVSKEGALLQEEFVAGDLVGVRAKVLRLKPSLHFLGFSNLCKIDMLFSHYKNAQAQRDSEHSAEKLSLAHPRELGKFLEAKWEEFFLQKTKSLWIKSAAWQATFFPLLDEKEKDFRGSFLLTLTEGGISSLALCEEKSVR